MAAFQESIQQTTSGTWAASGNVQILLDRVGLVTQYDLVFQITPSATAAGANQPDALWRPFRNPTFSAGGQTFFTLPDDAGGHDATLQHYLNVLDGFGQGFIYQLIVAPSQTFYAPRLTFHAGLYPKRRDGVPNPFDLSAFVPAGILAGAQIAWQTTANTVMDDVITLTSGTLFVTAHRVLGSEADIRAAMADQGLTSLLGTIGADGLYPGWGTNLVIPAATAANYGSELDAHQGGFLTRVTFLVQDATATRPARSDDTLTQIKLFIPDEARTILQVNTEVVGSRLPPGDFLVADDGALLGHTPAAGGIYPFDLRPYGRNGLEKVVGLDLRNRQTGYLKWGMTIAQNTAGDDILVLSERLFPYRGRLSNA